ncbi:MAG: PucR family transcriptional regulator [Aminipila sp.]
MSFTVLEATKLDTFNSFRLVAGHRGLDKIVEKVGILDWEFIKKIEEGPENISDFIEGEFVLSSLLFAKDKPELIIEAVKYLAESRVSGLAIKNIYYTELPEEVIHYANEKSLPVFVFHTVYFEDIITETMDKIRSINNSNLLESKVDLLINKNLNKTIIRDIALELNSSFKEFFIVLYAKGKKQTAENHLLSQVDLIRKDRAFKQNDTIIKYHDGLLLIGSFESLESSLFSSKAKSLLRTLQINSDEYFIGISNLHSNLGELGIAINESLFAVKSGEIFKSQLNYFKDIGIFSVLIPHSRDKWVKNFYEQIINPIKNYDEKYNTELFNTALKFVENDGNFIKTAEALFLHKNTIRYRINKIKELHHMENSELNFYEQLSIAIKLYKIYSN